MATIQLTLPIHTPPAGAAAGVYSNAAPRASAPCAFVRLHFPGMGDWQGGASWEEGQGGAGRERGWQGGGAGRSWLGGAGREEGLAGRGWQGGGADTFPNLNGNH